MKILILVLITCTSVHLFAGDNKDLKEKVVKVTIGNKGFLPAQIPLRPKENLILKITRTTDKTCMTELKNLDGTGVTPLPLNKETAFRVGSFKKAQKVKLLCGMDMTAGVVNVSQDQ